MILEKQRDFFDILRKEIEKNHISHAYLIETNNFTEIDEFVNYFVKMLLCPKKMLQEECTECNICNLIDKGNYPDLKIIEAEGNWIKKEQLLKLKIDFQSESIYNNKQIYVIKDASKLNASSGNTLLKFLEEPTANIIAILLTKNRYNVLDTIQSRCQIFSLNDANEEMILEENTIKLIKTLFSNNKGFLAYDSIIDLIPNKMEAINEFQIIENYFFMVINKKTSLIEDINYLKENQIIKLVLIIENYLKKMIYNLNYKLLIDNILIEISGVIK